MDSRREFLKKILLFSGAAGLSNSVPAAIQKALAIDPAPGSTFLDAEHVVILMQENRSFDHCFGTLRGVRGFNDRHVFQLPGKNLVWLQSDKEGNTYTPFHFDIRDTKATWMGSIPHSRSSQVDAFNGGRYNKWIDSKRSGNKKYSKIPLTMGYYNRNDIPFNYAMADAFTICDQNFCSAMTSTWPNRLYLWGGTLRGEKSMDSKAYIRNNIPWGEATWETFPEILEKNEISWKVYQNELSNGGGFKGEERSWLDNFGCNPLEQQAQFNSRFSTRYVNTLKALTVTLPDEISTLERDFEAMQPDDNNYEKKKKEISKKKEVLADAIQQLQAWSPENFDKLSPYQKNLFEKAFTTNTGDPDYLSLTSLVYDDEGTEREVQIPKGDVLYQFRHDVDSGKLPTVSWIVPSQKLSDHPSAPWYGAWYTSEILDILTKNPDVWRKTIFILTYDENDGYFDHIVPFTPPETGKIHTGKCSSGINETGAEYIKLENELAEGINKKEARGGPIGLGFRVPMIIASPWSRGGKVNSQVFDHTSVIQFLEHFLSSKYQKKIHQNNITEWRRTVCGNLTSAFDTFDGKRIEQFPFIKKDPFIEQIFNAQFTKEPNSFKNLTPDEIKQINNAPHLSEWMPAQETGTRIACALPYQLYSDASLSNDRKSVIITMQASNEVFGRASAGSPFIIYAREGYLPATPPGNDEAYTGGWQIWNFAVSPGDKLDYAWPLEQFENKNYRLRLHGPNGFYRNFSGNAQDPEIIIRFEYQRGRFTKSNLTGNVLLSLANTDKQQTHIIKVQDNAYHSGSVVRSIKPGSTESLILNLNNSSGWYDFTILVKGFDTFSRHYAGKVETGKVTTSDPAMSGQS